jgi:hypothetical protein
MLRDLERAHRERMARDGRRRECYFVDPYSRRKEEAYMSARLKSPEMQPKNMPARMFSKVELQI